MHPEGHDSEKKEGAGPSRGSRLSRPRGGAARSRILLASGAPEANLESVSRPPFEVKDCALAAIATGRRAQNLRELRDQIPSVPLDSIYYHFWGSRLRPSFDDPQYHNDFASWAHYGLSDDALAERLGVIDPGDFPDLESLRQEVLGVIEERLDESEHVPWSKADRQFHFIRSQIVVFRTPHCAGTPQELAQLLPRLSVGSIFYHFIDARQRAPIGQDDFRSWLAGFQPDCDGLVRRLGELDPHFVTLTELRERLVQVFREDLRP